MDCSQPRRKPLQPKNFQSEPSKPKPIKIVRLPSVEGNAADKENHPTSVEIGQLEASSLAEELGAVRRRREKLRSEKEKTERMLRERDRAMERALKEMERIGEEQRRLESELRRIAWIEELRACVRFTKVRSLREREEEKRLREEQLKEPSSTERNEAVQPSVQEEGTDN